MQDLTPEECAKRGRYEILRELPELAKSTTSITEWNIKEPNTELSDARDKIMELGEKGMDRDKHQAVKHLYQNTLNQVIDERLKTAETRQDYQNIAETIEILEENQSDTWQQHYGTLNHTSQEIREKGCQKSLNRIIEERLNTAQNRQEYQDIAETIKIVEDNNTSLRYSSQEIRRMKPEKESDKGLFSYLTDLL